MKKQSYRIYVKRIEYGYATIDSATSKEDALRQYNDDNFNEIYFDEDSVGQDNTWLAPSLNDVYPEIDF